MAKFGEQVKGFSIPVLNEREIRASSGILFVFALISLQLILFRGNFVLAKYFITLFLIEFLIRLFISPRYAPSLIIGRLIVSRQTPEYVGAPQKKFAWTIGLVLSAIMFFLMVIYNTYSAITGIICLICLIFLFFESAFGICIGCTFYGWIYKEKAQYCPGEVCDVTQKQDIQRTSVSQLITVLLFVAFIVLLVMLAQPFMKMQPEILWEKLKR